MSDTDRARRIVESEGKVIEAAFGASGSGMGHRGYDNVPAEVSDTLAILTDACGANLVSVIFFGSRLLGTSPNPHSAADLLVVVEDYRQFYHDLGRVLPARRRASIMAVLNRILPPNIISVKDPGDLRAGAKCFIVNTLDLRRGLSAGARDHFFRGRMMQRFQIVYARSEQDADYLERQLLTARQITLDWVPLYLPVWFAVLDYCRRMMEVSYASEIRPESRARVHEVAESQRHYFRLSYGRILNDAVAAGRLVGEGDMYRLATPPKRFQRVCWKVFFQKSRMRATLRWWKYMLTFDDWLDYIAQKVERRTGLHIELTPAERRFPIILLWPKAFRVFKVMREQDAARRNEQRGNRQGGRR